MHKIRISLMSFLFFIIEVVKALRTNPNRFGITLNANDIASASWVEINGPGPYHMTLKGTYTMSPSLLNFAFAVSLK